MQNLVYFCYFLFSIPGTHPLVHYGSILFLFVQPHSAFCVSCTQQERNQTHFTQLLVAESIGEFLWIPEVVSTIWYFWYTIVVSFICDWKRSPKIGCSFEAHLFSFRFGPGWQNGKCSQLSPSSQDQLVQGRSSPVSHDVLWFKKKSLKSLASWRFPMKAFDSSQFCSAVTALLCHTLRSNDQFQVSHCIGKPSTPPPPQGFFLELIWFYSFVQNFVYFLLFFVLYSRQASASPLGIYIVFYLFNHTLLFASHVHSKKQTKLILHKYSSQNRWGNFYKYLKLHKQSDIFDISKWWVLYVTRTVVLSLSSKIGCSFEAHLISFSFGASWQNGKCSQLSPSSPDRPGQGRSSPVSHDVL